MLNIYLTDLAAYNAGSLVGEWVSLPINDEELIQKKNEVLAFGAETVSSVNHEEWFITDYEWDDIAIFSVEEYTDIFNLNRQLQLLSDLDTDTLKAVKFLLYYGIVCDLQEAIEKADDVRIYEDQTMEDVAYALVEECYELSDLPSLIANNIDYKSIAYDLEIEGIYYVVDSDVYEYMG